MKDMISTADSDSNSSSSPVTTSGIQQVKKGFRSSQGMDSGFAGGEDETYNVYDQPFRGGRDMASNIYRPSKNIDKDAYSDDFDTIMHNNRYCALLWLCYFFNNMLYV